MIKSKKEITAFLYGCFLATERWKKRDDPYDYDSFILSNTEFLPENIDTKQTLEQRAIFYKGASEALNIILRVAEFADDNYVCIGPFFQQENYYGWKDRKKYEIFRSLNKVLGNKESILVDIEENVVFLGDIVAANFKYLSKIGLFLKKANALVLPTHNMELIVFSNTIDEAKKLFGEAITGTGWKIFEGI